MHRAHWSPGCAFLPLSPRVQNLLSIMHCPKEKHASCATRHPEASKGDDLGVMSQEGDLIPMLGTPKPCPATSLRLLENSRFCPHCPQRLANDFQVALGCGGPGGLHSLPFEVQDYISPCSGYILSWLGQEPLTSCSLLAKMCLPSLLEPCHP